jgi:RIO kinase 1
MGTMKPPERLQSLIEEGLIDTVVCQLMSGKEAVVYVVRFGGETRCGCSLWGDGPIGS